MAGRQAETQAVTWRDRAACLGHDPALWFPDVGHGPADRRSPEAVEICSTCPVQEQCGAFCAAHRLMYGIWAGRGAAFWRKQANEQGLPYLGTT